MIDKSEQDYSTSNELGKLQDSNVQRKRLGTKITRRQWLDGLLIRQSAMLSVPKKLTRQLNPFPNSCFRDVPLKSPVPWFFCWLAG